MHPKLQPFLNEQLRHKHMYSPSCAMTLSLLTVSTLPTTSSNTTGRYFSTHGRVYDDPGGLILGWVVVTVEGVSMSMSVDEEAMAGACWRWGGVVICVYIWWFADMIGWFQEILRITELPPIISTISLIATGRLPDLIRQVVCSNPV